MKRASPEFDGQSSGQVEWLALGLLGLLATVFAYHGWTTDSVGYLALAAGIVVVLAVRATRYWNHLLYVLLAVALAVESVRSLLNGDYRHLPIAVAGVLSVGFVFLAVYLFYTAEGAGQSPGVR